MIQKLEEAHPHNTSRSFDGAVLDIQAQSLELYPISDFPVAPAVKLLDIAHEFNAGTPRRVDGGKG